MHPCLISAIINRQTGNQITASGQAFATGVMKVGIMDD
jgi:hypothetical protein